MKRIVLILTALLLLGIGRQEATAQTTEWKCMNVGNRAFNAKQYDAAMKQYLAALKLNPHSSRARFNLGDCYLAKGDAKSAMEQYEAVTKTEQNATYKAMAYHNCGYIFHVAAGSNAEKRQQLLRQAIEQYKEALRLNPRDEDTRYNLALCQKQLKDDPQQNQQQNQQQKQQQQQQDQQQQQQQNQQQQNQQQQNQQQQRNPQTEQYMNLARQAERRALEKVKQSQPRHKSLDKNW